MAGQAKDRSELIAQAIRFLTSARVTDDATDETKREFLRSKGLTEDEIETVFQDAQNPATSSSTPEVSQENAYERAAREFDDPINVSPPPATYPKSPLALYYEAASTATPTATTRQETRYQVLLRFFKTLSYIMMLGGGATALCISLYRTYILPRIAATFDARSAVLQHHHTLFDKLRTTVSTLATYTPRESIQEAKQKKGVLKKVHFGDEVDGGKLEQEKATEKVVTLGTDVVFDAPTEKTVLLEGDVEGEEVEEQPKLDPIDVTEPIRSSLARLAAALKSDMSFTAGPSTHITPSTARSATVADESEEEWESDSNSDDDDGLEFDPYGSYQKKKKHTQAPQQSRDPATALKAALSSLSLDIHSQRLNQNTYASSATSHMRIGGTSSGTAGSGDIGQVRAEIRSLKGLLLSRRNFPSYARPGAVASATPQPTSTFV